VACRSGYQDFCSTNQYSERGIQKAHGFLTEQVIEDENNLIVVPASLHDVGVLVEPLTVTEKALRQVESIQRRLPWLAEAEVFASSSSVQPQQGRALVFGAGPVGLLAAMALQFRGFETFVYSREPAYHLKAKITRQIGAIYLSTDDVPIDLLPHHLGPIDLIYEAAGSSQPTFNLLPVLAPNGVFVLTGIPGHDRPTNFDMSRLMRDMVLKNQLMLGTVNATAEDFRRAVLDLQCFAGRWPDNVKQLISGRYSMHEYESLALSSNGSIKNVLMIAG
jgi:threonine dehydrogenase-like Zn-dependent dehydrogenase